MTRWKIERFTESTAIFLEAVGFIVSAVSGFLFLSVIFSPSHIDSGGVIVPVMTAMLVGAGMVVLSQLIKIILWCASKIGREQGE